VKRKGRNQFTPPEPKPLTEEEEARLWRTCWHLMWIRLGAEIATGYYSSHPVEASRR
jgi:hypothetical protein